jgi:hypothetical protein
LHNSAGFDLVAPGADGFYGDPVDTANRTTPGNSTVFIQNGDWICDDISNFEP